MLDKRLIFNNDSSFRWYLSNAIVKDDEGIWKLIKPKTQQRRKNDGISAAMCAMFVYLEVMENRQNTGLSEGGFISVKDLLRQRQAQRGG